MGGLDWYVITSDLTHFTEHYRGKWAGVILETYGYNADDCFGKEEDDYQEYLTDTQRHNIISALEKIRHECETDPETMEAKGKSIGYGDDLDTLCEDITEIIQFLYQVDTGEGVKIQCRYY